MRNEDGQTIRLEDYRPYDYLVHSVDLDFTLGDGETTVRSRLILERRPGEEGYADLVLDGDEIEMTSIAVDGAPLEAGLYELTPERLVIQAVPQEGRFTLEVVTRLEPEKNSKLMGLYRTKGVWCTQCEAEGFRRITFFPDRPDVLSRYRVRVEADRAAAPILLSNGNPGERGELPGGRHFAVWDDPHPKPSYLFALVAGDLDVLTDGFTTAGGRKVDLAIYTEKGLAGRAAYAMDALKRSMVWDEKRFGREYDLDIFNIVAVSDFNMGAMENKGLNVFNHKYVLLDPQTATDGDYAGVETVIAHEYFHNWTGNRITCRDWFQLCLKEGLTVYRDQEFSADERSRAVKRIASVASLRAHQFPEDQGPLQHPVRPTRYREINNFYTATVYDKGAELVRMIATILGEDGFRAGMDLYFERHDGEATTIEAFIACFEEVTGTDLTQFALWYSQAGTPTLTVRESFEAGTLTLTLSQHLDGGAAQTGTAPMHLPVRFALVGPDGAEIDAKAESAEARVADGIIHLTTAEATIVFTGLAQRPLLSILRDFSAPVTLVHEQSAEDRAALARRDPNDYARWAAVNGLVETMLVGAAREGFSEARDGETIDALVEAAGDENLEPALRALIATLPGEVEIARLVAKDVDPEAVHAARIAALTAIGRLGAGPLAALRESLATDADFSPDAASAGQRALRNAVLAPLSLAAGDPGAAAAQYAGATNMTDRLAGLSVLVHHFAGSAAAEDALADFYGRFETDDLVIDKWFAIQATAPAADTLERVAALQRHPAFRLANPNRARSLIGSFAAANPLAFHRADGRGQAFVAEQLVALDRLNPQTAARLATSFRTWRSLEPIRRENARAALAAMQDEKSLSKDLKDIVERTLQ
ncbi:aminopeptidase N [Aureimonas mangrovi]|uniref:aminopeptidase N n=1 Tax=Aureimonas mangrovi TaxID=2758041 RepID=UPI00163D9C59|nr:aminopeptidase N [Aureimonas mangrovi]